ncbi:hypothetical protein U1Q18_020376 [Sarracenia purpurea var. burkii]
MTTMMSNLHRRFLSPPNVGPSNKRKERDGFEAPKPSYPKLVRHGFSRPGSSSPTPKPPEPSSNNQLLAGYLAHEFLTKGSLFGQPWDPARAEAVPVTTGSAEPRRLKPFGSSQKPKPGRSPRAEPEMEKYQRYREVADLLKTDGAHVPDIVNPTQLAHLLQL